MTTQLQRDDYRLMAHVQWWRLAEMFRHFEVADKHAAIIREVLDARYRRNEINH